MSVSSVPSSSNALPWLQAGSVGSGTSAPDSPPPPPPPSDPPPGYPGPVGSLFDKVSSALQAALLQVQGEQSSSAATTGTASSSGVLDTLLKEIVDTIQNGTTSAASTTTGNNGLPAPLNRMVNALALATAQALHAYSRAQQTGGTSMGTV